MFESFEHTGTVWHSYICLQDHRLQFGGDSPRETGASGFPTIPQVERPLVHGHVGIIGIGIKAQALSDQRLLNLLNWQTGLVHACHACICNMYIYIHSICVYVYVYVYMYMYICMCDCVCVCKYKHAYILYVCVHICIYIYTYMHMHKCPSICISHYISLYLYICISV